MKILALAALPAALLATACGEPMDGSDTADLGADVTEGQTGSNAGADYQPGADGPLQADVEPTQSTDTMQEPTMQADQVDEAGAGTETDM